MKKFHIEEAIWRGTRKKQPKVDEEFIEKWLYEFLKDVDIASKCEYVESRNAALEEYLSCDIKQLLQEAGVRIKEDK